MLLILGPAKKMDFSDVKIPEDSSTPIFQQQAENIVELLRKAKPEELKEKLKLSDDDVDKVTTMFKEFDNTKTPHKPAIFAFDNEMYRKIKDLDLNGEVREYAQKHIRILSSLYGVLRPMDLIKEFRSNFFFSVENLGAQNLFDYWRDLITQELIKDAEEVGKEAVSLVCDEVVPPELFDAVRTKIFVVSIKFKDWLDGEWKMSPENSADAKGELIKWIIKDKVDTLFTIKTWQYNGYALDPNQSTDNVWVFTKSFTDEPA